RFLTDLTGITQKIHKKTKTDWKMLVQTTSTSELKHFYPIPVQELNFTIYSWLHYQIIYNSVELLSIKSEFPQHLSALSYLKTFLVFKSNSSF
uniref:Uncharacterized protein n=1 Tax=Catharus ustulatus TaxID=91951 RepID=A0A8C3USY1_CATUS